MNTPLKSYGFTYEFEGARFMFHVYDTSPELAQRRVLAMAESNFEGELKNDATEQELSATTHRP